MNFGIIGLGNIAKKFAEGITYVNNATLYGVAARDLNKAQKFKKEFGAEKAYGSYEELMKDPNIDTVYIALPHPFHYENGLIAIDNKKNVICEKPCGMNQKEVIDLINKAKKANIYFAEGFMYRSHPQTQKIAEIIKSGKLGEIKSIFASFGYNFMGMDVPPERIYRKELGGGGIYDVGCYPLSFVRYIVKNYYDSDFLPDKFYAVGVTDKNGIDQHTKAILQFKDISCEISTSIDCHQPNDAFIYGTKGYLHIKDPFTCQYTKNAMELVVKDKTEHINIKAKNLYSYEIDMAVKYENNKENPYITHKDSINNAILIDKWIEMIK